MSTALGALPFALRDSGNSTTPLVLVAGALNVGGLTVLDFVGPGSYSGLVHEPHGLEGF